MSIQDMKKLIKMNKTTKTNDGDVIEATSFSSLFIRIYSI